MIPRRSVPVEVTRTPKPGEAISLVCSDAAFVARGDGQDLIAICVSAKRLSDWLFDHHASEVRHDYDLQLSDGEP